MNPRGISIHVAVNRSKMRRYTPLEPLASPARSAEAMQRIAEREGFETQTLVGPAATCAAVTAAIRAAAGPVGGDGILLLTYSGHGDVVVPAGPGGDREVEDQCWCLYDGQLVDDDLYRLWAGFEPGARIVVISDSCHSGSIIRASEPAPATWTRARRVGLQRRDGGPALPSRATSAPNGGQTIVAEPEPPKVAAKVLLLAAAGNRQQGREHSDQSLFTRALLDVWEDGAFQGSYLDLYDQISEKLKGKPRPIYYGAMASPEFAAQRPFTITPPRTG
jgi:hypothetical protein